MAYIGNTPANIFTSLETQTITGDGSTEYTLTHAVSSGKDILVYINNVKQEEGSGKSYTATGNTITFSDAVASTDSCYLLYVNRAIATHTPADASVDADAIAGSAVVAGKIASSAVTTAKIAADAVTGAKIADDAIDSEHYTDGSIDTAHIADLQVTTAKIAADAITGAKIADDAIDSEHYTDGSIDTAHLANNSVGITQLNVSDGSSGQFLRTDGSGTLSFATVSTSTAFDDVTAGDAAINVTTTAGDITIDAQGNDTDIIFKGTDNNSDITMLTLDGSEDGHATFKNGITLSDGNLTVASGHGIDFSATANASGMSNELLDDYEEGSFTPAGVSFSLDSSGGRYTKIGNTVHCIFFVQYNSTGDSVQNIISGFPFTASNLTNLNGGFHDSFNSTQQTVSSVAIGMQKNTTRCQFYSVGGDQIENANQYRNGTRTLTLVGHYQTDS